MSGSPNWNDEILDARRLLAAVRVGVEARPEMRARGADAVRRQIYGNAVLRLLQVASSKNDIGHLGATSSDRVSEVAQAAAQALGQIISQIPEPWRSTVLAGCVNMMTIAGEPETADEAGVRPS